MKNPIVYSKSFIVDKSVIDHFNHVNNLAYVRWALEISKEHWNSSTTKDIQSTYGWMILNHNLTYKKQAKLGDELLITTHIQENSTATSVRRTEVLFKHNNQVIFESLAKWCFVKLDTQKPAKIPENVLKPFYNAQ